MWRGETEVFEQTASVLDAWLSEGVTLEGTVVDPSRSELSGVHIKVGESYGLLGSLTVTAEDGSFRLEDLEPGEVRVLADAGPRGSASRSFFATSGEVLVWDAVLASGGEIVGRVLDESGRPLEHWFLTVNDPGPVEGPRDYRSAETDAQGRFVFENVHERPHVVEATAPGGGVFASLEKSDVFPGPEELLLCVESARLPSVRIVGRLVDPAGAAVSNAQLGPCQPAYEHSPIETPGKDGGFALGPYPPGEWRLFVRPPEGPELLVGPKELVAGETWDCGTIELWPAGTLVVRTQQDGGTTVLQPSFIVFQGPVWRRQWVRREGDAWRSDPLPPGDYRLSVGGEGVAALLVPFSIRSGETTRLEVPLRPGIPCEIRVAGEDSTARAQPRLRLTGSDGSNVQERELWAGKDGVFRLELFLAPGVYRAAAWRGEARTEGELRVDPGTDATALLRLELR